MIPVNKSIRSAFGVVVLVVLIVLVMSFLGAYRHAATSAKDDSGTSKETTGSAEASGTAKGSEKGSEGEKTATVPESKGIGTVSVVVDGLNFRVDPTRDSELIRGLDAGEKLTLLEKLDGWYKVQDSSNQVGYVSSSDQYTKLEE